MRANQSARPRRAAGPSPERYLAVAVEAAHAAGRLMRDHWHKPKRINSASRHDVKLELDVRCQERIEALLRRFDRAIPVLGEEGSDDRMTAAQRWVVDPIDGTVNYAYGIPHACVSIALQQRSDGGPERYETRAGVVFDPFAQELWTAIRGGPALLNGRKISVSNRTRLGEAIVSIGFAKSRFTLGRMLPLLNALLYRVRKLRIMGAAALAMTYVASGRFDAYVEHGLRLWDIAAGGLIVECAGGEFWREPLRRQHSYRIMAHNGHLRSALLPLMR